MEEETALTGGNTNTSVVRTGNTVRRAMRPASATVHRLLDFLRAQSYEKAPMFLGIDAKGREILSYIEGDCKISASAWQSDKLMVSTAKALRAFHDTTALYPRQPNDNWSFSYPDASRHEVICHNDFGLYNLVIGDDELKGIIDFDLAGPGPRLRDIAYAAYWLVPLSFNAEDMKPFTLADQNNGFRRLTIFCECCGVARDEALLDMISEVLHFMASEQSMADLFGNDVAKQLTRDGHLQHWSAEAQAFDDSRSVIETALRT